MEKHEIHNLLTRLKIGRADIHDIREAFDALTAERNALLDAQWALVALADRLKCEVQTLRRALAKRELRVQELEATCSPQTK
jgi:hypothetical protein